MSEQVVFIDSGVPDIQVLLDGLNPGEQAFVIDGNSDGLDQIAATLKANDLTGLSSISIVGHGASGEIDLGSTAIDDANLSSDAAALSTIGASLATGGNLSLYACDTAAGASGHQFIADLSAYAGGADVAAATHLVGSADLGGSWTLDASTDAPAAPAAVPFSEQALANFQGTLSALAVTAGATATFHGGGAAQPLDPGLTVTDASSTTLMSAAVQILGFTSGDTLNFTDTAQIHGSYNANIGVLTLSGTDTVADYQAALRSVTYSFAGSGDPTLGGADPLRVITWEVNDGSTTNETPSPIHNDQPTLGLNQLVVLDGMYPSRGDGTSDGGGIPMGALVTFAGNFAWGGTEQADGQSLSISQNAALFSIVGTMYGGNGTSSFQLPNLQGQLAVGYDNNPNTALGETYGSDNVTLTAQNLPPQLTGSSVPFSNDQPSLTVNYLINTSGAFPGSNSTDVLGEVVPFLGTFAPTGYMLANGQLLAISQYSALFAVIGTTYGGNGTTTFALPNLTGSTIIGAGTDAVTGGTVALGTTTGQDQISLSMSNLPAPEGSNQAISNSQPSVALTYLIATEGLYPSSSGTAGATTTPYLGEIIAFAGTAGTLSSMLTSGGWAVANGQLLSIATNEPLFTVLGTTYGGNGQTTFALPDLVGQSIAGVGSNNGTSVSLGQNYGSSGITLTSSQLPVTTSTLDTVHTAPIVTAGATATFESGGAAAPLDSALTVSDADSGGNLTGATIAIGTGFAASDTLNFINQNAITGSYNASTGVLTLTGTDTLAHYQAALDSITFSTGVANAGSRTIDWSVTDGSPSNGTSAIAASVLNVVQGGPQLTVGAPHVTFTGGGAPQPLDSGLTVTDADSQTLVSATVSISGGFFAGDQLNFSSQNGITGSYDAAHGVLTLFGTSSIANYQAALQSVTFSESGNADPTGGGSDTTRTISWSVNDGSSTSNTGASTLTTVHVAPVVTAGGMVTFTGGGTAVALDSTLTLADVDSGGNLTSATIAIGELVAGDTLNFLNQNGITGSYDAAHGVLTLSGTSSIANYQAALRSVTFSESGNADPTGGGTDPTRTISWSVNDGSSTSNTGTSTLTTVHVAPTVTAGATATFESGGAAAPLDSALTVSDADSGGNLTGATIAIGTGFAASDTLNFINQNAITGSYNASTGVLTLTGTDTLAHYQAALDSITFSTGVANAGSRTIDWSVTDGSPSNGTSAIAASVLNVVQGGPQLTVGAPHVTFTGGGAPQPLDSGLTVTDADSQTLVSATVSISGGFFAGDILNFSNNGSTEGDITGSYNSSTGVLTLSSAGATATLAQWAAALQSVTFSESGNADPTHGGSDTTRTISWSVNDGSSISNAGASTLTTVHVAPVVTAGGTVTFTGDGTTVALDSTLTLADVDSGGTLTGATVSIDSTHFLGGDMLNFVSQNGITGSYDAAHGVLTLSGTSSIANYQAALQSVTFSESSGHTDPTGGGSDTTRTISWSVNDGSSTSNTATTGLGVDSSLATANPDSNHVLAGQTVTADAAHGVLANDTDSNPADHVVVSAVDGLAAGVNQSVAGAYGSLTLHADGSYSYTASGAATGVEFDTFTYTASNGHGAPSTSTLTVEVTGANQNYVQVPSGGSATGGYNNTVLDGSAGGATLTAAATFNAHQILVGGPGDILNAASYGQDTFVFADNFGHETVNNFHPALDVIQLQQSQFGSLAAVMADIQQVGADSVLTLDANHIITITNTQHTSLTASDFHLV